MCLIKNSMQNKFELLPDIYFQNICIVAFDFLVIKISALPCILNGGGNSVSVISY